MRALLVDPWPGQNSNAHSFRCAVPARLPIACLPCARRATRWLILVSRKKVSFRGCAKRGSVRSLRCDLPKISTPPPCCCLTVNTPIHLNSYQLKSTCKRDGKVA
jgi:hypothetical protein